MRENCWVLTYTAAAKQPDREGEDEKEKPEGCASFPDRSSLSLAGHSQSHVNVPGAKVKRGTHTQACVCICLILLLS